MLLRDNSEIPDLVFSLPATAYAYARPASGRSRAEVYCRLIFGK